MALHEFWRLINPEFISHITLLKTHPFAKRYAEFLFKHERNLCGQIRFLPEHSAEIGALHVESLGKVLLPEASRLKLILENIKGVYRMYRYKHLICLHNAPKFQLNHAL